MAEAPSKCLPKKAAMVQCQVERKLGLGRFCLHGAVSFKTMAKRLPSLSYTPSDGDE